MSPGSHSYLRVLQLLLKQEIGQYYIWLCTWMIHYQFYSFNKEQGNQNLIGIYGLSMLSYFNIRLTHHHLHFTHPHPFQLSMSCPFLSGPVLQTGKHCLNSRYYLPKYMTPQDHKLYLLPIFLKQSVPSQNWYVRLGCKQILISLNRSPEFTVGQKSI